MKKASFLVNGTHPCRTIIGKMPLICIISYMWQFVNRKSSTSTTGRKLSTNAVRGDTAYNGIISQNNGVVNRKSTQPIYDQRAPIAQGGSNRIECLI